MLAFQKIEVPKNKPHKNAWLKMNRLIVRSILFISLTLLLLNSFSSTESSQILQTGNVPQTVMVKGGELTPNNQIVHLAKIDSTTRSASFFLLSTESTTVYTLLAPDGTTINPELAQNEPNIAYNSSFSDFWGHWVYFYDITTPQEGAWLNILESPVSADYVLNNYVETNIVLSHTTQNYNTYQPNELITLEAALVNQGVSIFDNIILEATATYPDDATVVLNFNDSGINGDQIANDGIYTTQFTAGNFSRESISVNFEATKDNIMRYEDTSIPVSRQTANFQDVFEERVNDSDWDSFYDRLEITTSINVTEAGHYSVEASLIDMFGNQIGRGYYSTRRRDGVPSNTPIESGTHLMTLEFDGDRIYNHGLDGPYRLTNLTIEDTTGGTFEVDSETEIFYTTQPYSFSDFGYSAPFAISISASSTSGNSNFLPFIIFACILTLLTLSGWVALSAGYSVTKIRERVR